MGVWSNRKLQIVQSDVCGVMFTKSLGSHKYFVTFTDYCSPHCYIYFMKHQSEVLSKFRNLITTNDCDLKIGALRTDNGCEYISIELKECLKHMGISHKLTIQPRAEWRS